MLGLIEVVALEPNAVARIESLTIGLPPVTCAMAWVFWIRERNRTAKVRWRQITSRIALALVTMSIALGAFALVYWNRSDQPSPPQATVITTYCGFILALLASPCSALAISRTRVMLVLCSFGLLWFYLELFISP